MKDEFKKILEEHRIYFEDVEEILFAVSDMLNLVADKTKKEEPYAVNTIKHLESSAYEVFSLANDLS